mmetsp:Transcript_79198/g.229049  ORF Transcript_79198/g.229049 Transcript_79198/m.229049 type:complete len:407 (+) Transcript_79198:239-1459(+)
MVQHDIEPVHLTRPELTAGVEAPPCKAHHRRHERERRPHQIRHTDIEPLDIEVRVLLGDLPQGRSQRPLRCRRRNAEHLVEALRAMLEVVATLVQGVIRQVAHTLVHVLLRRLLVCLCAETGQALLAQEHMGRRVHRPADDCDIDPEVELQAAVKERLFQISLHHSRAIGLARHLDIQVPRALDEENAVALGAVQGLDDVGFAGLCHLFPQLVHLVGQDPGARRKRKRALGGEILAQHDHPGPIAFVAKLRAAGIARDPGTRRQGQTLKQVGRLHHAVDRLRSGRPGASGGRGRPGLRVHLAPAQVLGNGSVQVFGGLPCAGDGVHLQPSAIAALPAPPAAASAARGCSRAGARGRLGVLRSIVPGDLGAPRNLGAGAKHLSLLRRRQRLLLLLRLAAASGRTGAG